MVKLFKLILLQEDFCVTIPKIAALLAYLNSAINPYLYSFLGTNLKQENGSKCRLLMAAANYKFDI